MRNDKKTTETKSLSPKKAIQYFKRFQLTGNLSYFNQFIIHFEPTTRMMVKTIQDRYKLSYHDAENCSWKAIDTVARKARKYDPNRKFQPWFFTVLKNIAIDEVDRRNRESTFLKGGDKAATTIGSRQDYLEDIALNCDDPCQAMIRREDVEMVRAAMLKLRPKDQETIFGILDGKTASEAAAEFGVLRETIIAWRHRARQRLKKILEADNPDSSA